MSQLLRLRMRHYRVFLALCEHSSLTRAAEVLGTVQPALSRTLRELEHEVGFQVFERTSHGLVLTQKGETLRQYVSAGFAQIEKGVLQAGGGREVATVSLGILPNVARTIVPAAIARFKQEMPNVRVRLFSASVSEIVALMRNGEVDFLASRMLALKDQAGCTFEYLYSEPLIFAAGSGHPLAQEETVKLDAIDRHCVLIPTPGTIIRTELDRFLFSLGFGEFSNYIETISTEFIRFYLLQHGAVACVPLGTVRKELAEGSLVELKTGEEELQGSVGLSFLAGRDLSVHAARLAQFLREAAMPYRDA